MRAVLVGGAPVPAAFLRRALRELRVGPRDLVVGVDAGARRLARLGVEPGLSVGDWDSSGGRAPRGPHLTLPREKDRSDLHYALAAARNAGASELVALAVTGGRPDHHQAGLLELAQAACSFRSVSALGPEAEYFFVSGPGRWKGRPRGRVISVLPLLGPARGVTLRGMRYAMKAAVLDATSRGLSNESLGSLCHISVKSGSLVIIIPRHRAPAPR